MTPTKNQDESQDVESPFSEEYGSTLVDMTKHTGLVDPEAKVFRVQLRRVKEPIVDGGPETRPVEDGFVIGVIDEANLPKPGEIFKMSYHALNTSLGFGAGRLQDYGQIDTKTAIKDLIKVEDAYYFETGEGSWRLKILDVGN
jgi:hypothetical protein